MPATHGMLIFGNKTLYASHLPMFHSPHDYQAIFELRFDASTLQVYLDDKLQSPNSIYTFVPEPFVLTDLEHGLQSMKGTLYHGHFEKGGTPMTGPIRVGVVKTISFKKLRPTDPNSNSYPGIIFGNNDELFMAHQLEGAPGFDQIVELMPNPMMKSASQAAWFLGFIDISNKALSVPTTLYYPHVGAIQVRKQIYLEWDDLKQ